MTHPDQRTNGWVPFIAAVAQNQMRTELNRAFLEEPAKIEKNFVDLGSFHRALRGDMPTEELAVLEVKVSRRHNHAGQCHASWT